MKSMTGRFLRKLKSISTVTSLRQGIVFHASSTVENRQADENCNNFKDPFPGRISVSKVLKNEVQDDDIDSLFHDCWKEKNPMENAEIPSPVPVPLDCGSTKSSTVPLPAEMSSNESGIGEFQPNPFELMVMEHESRVKTNESGEYPMLLDSEENHPPGGNERVIQKAEESEEFPRLLERETRKAEEESGEFPTLMDFEENCPPEGSERVILYTTSLKGIRKTFEECNRVRFLVESFKVIYVERDISMHLEFREELWRIFGGKVVPPRLFIKGRHIGGAEEVVRLHEQGRLSKLFQGIPVNLSTTPCRGCGGMRFVVCFRCNGSRKSIPDEPTGELTWIRCLECNANGLIKCPICC